MKKQVSEILILYLFSVSCSAVLTRRTIIFIHTDEILLSLADIYVNDPRFRKNTDAAGGEGTVEFVRRAICSMTK